MLKAPYVVTGASRGLGRAIARNLAECGHPIIALSRDAVSLGLAGAEFADIQADSITITCDLADRADIAAAAEQIKAKTGWIAGIVHNAGIITPIKSMADVDRANWARNIQINLVGVQDLTNRLMPVMGGKEQSRITTISSGASLRAISGWSAYCVAKAGLDMWAKCMAEEGAESNISTISVAPGIVDTDMQKTIRSSNESDFPDYNTFVELHKDGQLVDPKLVAGQLGPLITGHSMQQSGMRFDVREL
jgi:NAD(P)-dependent dehydrogenase (short-subunit alcohol dehydrogenase family)